MAFGIDVIRSVVNPLGRITGAIHVYGGDFFGVNRNEWDPESLHEKPLDIERVLRMFVRSAVVGTMAMPRTSRASKGEAYLPAITSAFDLISRTTESTAPAT